MKFKKSFLYISIIFITISSLLVACIDSQKGNDTNLAEQKSEKEEKKIYASLTGEEIPKEELNENRIFAVMLDNHPDAQPQAGINDTDILYEFKAEGEFTRYLGLFKSKLPDVNIGPVRSARPYFVRVAKEYDAIYAHWGGSPEGYAEIPKIGVDDLDGIALEGINYFRNKDVNKKRPHDGYTTFNDLKNGAEKRGFSLNSNNSFCQFDQSEDKEKINSIESIECPKLTLNFFKTYNEEINYQPETDDYKILRNGEKIIDENTKLEYNPSNIIILLANSKVTGANGTLTIYNVGEGNGYLMTHGKLVEIKWTKEDETAKTKFTLKDGGEFYLNPGKTFIATIDDNENSVVYEKPQSESNGDAEINK